MGLRDMIAAAQEPTSRDPTDDEIIDEHGSVFLEDTSYFLIENDDDAERAVERILTHEARLARLTAQYEYRKRGLELQIEGYRKHYDHELRQWLAGKLEGVKRRYHDLMAGRVALRASPAGVFLDEGRGGKARLTAWAVEHRPELVEEVITHTLADGALEKLKAEVDAARAEAEKAREEDTTIPFPELPDGLRYRAHFDDLRILAPKLPKQADVERALDGVAASVTQKHRDAWQRRQPTRRITP